MGEAELHLVLVQEVLGHRALHRLPVLKLKGEALHLGGPARHVAHAVLALQGPAVGDLNLQALDLLGELDPHGVSQWLPLVVDIANIQHLVIYVLS